MSSVLLFADRNAGTDMHRPNSQLSQNFTNALEQILAQYADQRYYMGLVFQQGGRTMIQINIPAHELNSILQVKPLSGNDPNSGKDRPPIENHIEEIEDYITNRVNNKQPWLTGTLTANIAPESISIIELYQNVCLVLVPPEIKFDIADGQHRKMAIDNITQSRSILQDDLIPILVILEDNLKQCQSDFRDIAQSKPVDRSLLLSFGENKGVSGIAKNIIEQVPMFKGKTDRVSKTPGKKTKLIYTTKYIAALVSFAFTDQDNKTLEDCDMDIYTTAIGQALNQFFSECHQTQYIFQNRIENLALQDIQEFKKYCVLGVSIGLQLLGKLFYCTYDSSQVRFNSRMIKQLSELDWLRSNSLWQSNIIRVNPDGKTYINYSASSVTDAVKAVKKELNWDVESI